MDVDSPPLDNQQHSNFLIVQRLLNCGVPEWRLINYQRGLVDYVKENSSEISNIVSQILAVPADALEAQGDDVNIKEFYDSSLSWVQWLMFGADPHVMLKSLKDSSGQRAVCGAVWGLKDLAYRCRTCEHDPTCAICVPCFQNGNHKDHDYSIMYTGGGCCDCGDATAWKREGFCSVHKGVENIKPLSDDLADSVGPALDALFIIWKEQIDFVESTTDAHTKKRAKVISELTSAIVDMLLDICKDSESLLCFVSRRMYMCEDMLSALTKSQCKLEKTVAKKLIGLFLKLISEPNFKYELSKAFVEYYRVSISEVIKGCSDDLLEKFPLISSLSVQIFTVSSLTARLVREVDLLGVLLQCFMDLFVSFVGEDGRLQASKWSNLYETTLLLALDIHYVLSHEEVSSYVAHERTDVATTWMKILFLVQGMDSQKRATNLHIEDENENLSAPFVLGHYLCNVHKLLAREEIFLVDPNKSTYVPSFSLVKQGWDAGENRRYAKVGKLSDESSFCLRSGQIFCNTSADGVAHPAMSCFPVWLIWECLRAIEGHVVPDITFNCEVTAPSSTSTNCFSLMSLRNRFLSFKKGKEVTSTEATGQRVDGIARLVKSFPSVHDSDSNSPFSEVKMHENSSIADKRKMFDNDGPHMFHKRMPVKSLPNDRLLHSGPDVGKSDSVTSTLIEWPDIAYDVSSQAVSFHIPLHRLLSLLLWRAIGMIYDEEKASKKLISPTPPALKVHQDEFSGQVLKPFKIYGFSAIVLEHPLRIRVFCAQVLAGMWRRNGDAAILSVEWYRSVQWAEQGLEADLFLMQFCAALAPPECLVKTIVERFGLSSYTSLDAPKPDEFESVLVQEMLTFMIQLVKERRYCGLSTNDVLKRELICKLAVGDFTHSQLVKSLPCDLSHNDQLQCVLNTVAVYSNPVGMKQGKYSLRKLYWKELDLYHPRWNARDLQVAEERYFQVCKVSALNDQLPQWSKIHDPLKDISNIATSRSVLQIVRAVLFYYLQSDQYSGSRTSENNLVATLHLIALALNVCDSKLQSSDTKSKSLQCEDELGAVLLDNNLISIPFLAHVTENYPEESDPWKRHSVLSLLVALMHKKKGESDHNYSGAKFCNISSLVDGLLKKFAGLSRNCMVVLRQLAPDTVSLMPEAVGSGNNSASPSNHDDRKAKARQHQAAILEKMRAEQSKFAEGLKSLAYEEEADEQDSPYLSRNVPETLPACSLCREIVCQTQSPLCYLVLLQKSRLATFVDKVTPSWDSDGLSDNASTLVKGKSSAGSTCVGSSSSINLGQNIDQNFSSPLEPAEIDAFLDFSNEQPIIRYIQLPTGNYTDNSQEDLSLHMIEDDIYSSVTRYMSNTISDVMDDDKICSTSESGVGIERRGIKRSVLGTYVACLSRELSKHHNSSIFMGASSKSSNYFCRKINFGPADCDGIHISSCGHAVHQDCHERYLLSLKQRYVRRLGFEGGHIVDPDQGELLCPVCRRFANSILPASIKFSSSSWKMMNLTPSNTREAERTKTLFPCAISLLEIVSKTVGQVKVLGTFFGSSNETTEPSMQQALLKLSKLYFPDNSSNLLAQRQRNHSLVLWDTLRYTIICTEIAARGRMNLHAKEPESCLDSLYGELNSSGGFVMLLLFRIAHSARALNRLDVLLRFKGIQLLAGSVCSGRTMDSDLSSTIKCKGMLPSMLEHGKEGESFPDVLFWRQCANPIISQDPFSSLMWVLYCLPLPFLSSSEFFIPLVNLFYLVCIIQAIITCYSREDFELASFHDNPLIDVCKKMSQCDSVRCYFVSNYLSPSCQPKDMVRRLTLPYLRKCALLHKLLQSSCMSPLYDSSIMRGSSNCPRVEVFDDDVYVTQEMNQLRELEGLFQIQSFDSILRNETSHSIASRWCQHFCKDFISQGGDMLFSTPVIPFRLVQLPQLYQDILERFVKCPCSECGNVPEEPALCLLCAKLCSPSWKPCCRQSKCQNHASSCGSGIGVFLLVRRTTILLQRSARLASWPSPYLDAFGEEDHEIQRGKPLYLSEERYAGLTYLVASHSLDRTSEVLRQTTLNFYALD